MQDFNIIHVLRKNDLICIVFRLRENDGFSMQTFVAQQNVSQSRISVEERTVDCKMLHSRRSFVFKILNKVKENMLS